MCVQARWILCNVQHRPTPPKHWTHIATAMSSYSADTLAPLDLVRGNFVFLDLYWYTLPPIDSIDAMTSSKFPIDS